MAACGRPTKDIATSIPLCSLSSQSELSSKDSGSSLHQLGTIHLRLSTRTPTRARRHLSNASATMAPKRKATAPKTGRVTRRTREVSPISLSPLHRPTLAPHALRHPPTLAPLRPSQPPRRTTPNSLLARRAQPTQRPLPPHPRAPPFPYPAPRLRARPRAQRHHPPCPRSLAPSANGSAASAVRDQRLLLRAGALGHAGALGV